MGVDFLELMTQDFCNAELVGDKICRFVDRLNEEQTFQLEQLLQKYGLLLGQSNKLEFDEIISFMQAAQSENPIEVFVPFLATVFLSCGEFGKAGKVFLEVEYLMQ